jgi:alpha-1,4-digalacturonate transport system permease protein
MTLRLLRFAALLVSLPFFLGPLLSVVVSSFEPPLEIFGYPPRLWPSRLTLDNYQQALAHGDFVLYFLNSTVVAIAASVISVGISVAAGFALAKYRFPGEGAVFMAIMGTLMVPLQVLLVPMFITLKSLGWIDSLVGIIVPPAATPTGVFLMRQYIRSIPDELLDAARVDGAGEISVLARIVLPLSLPALASLAIFSFVWRWNDFLWPFLVINDQRKWTVQLALANYVGQYDINWPSLLAMTTLSMVPMMVVFVLFQRYFMRGFVLSGLKG